MGPTFPNALFAIARGRWRERETFRISGLHRALEDAGGGGYCHLRAGCSGARALPLNAERRPQKTTKYYKKSGAASWRLRFFASGRSGRFPARRSGGVTGNRGLFHPPVRWRKRPFLEEKMGETGLSEGPWTARPPGPYAIFRSENDIRRAVIHIYPEKTRGHPRQELYTEEGQRKEKKATPQESTSI